MAHPGVGSTGHLATLLLAQALGVERHHIRYRGAAPTLQDMLGGHIDLFFATPQQVVGAVRGPAPSRCSASPRRTPRRSSPACRASSRAMGQSSTSFWHIMLAPAGTPKPIVDALDGALQEAMDDPEVLKVWALSGMAPYPKAQRTPAGATA